MQLQLNFAILKLSQDLLESERVSVNSEPSHGSDIYCVTVKKQ